MSGYAQQIDDLLADGAADGFARSMHTLGAPSAEDIGRGADAAARKDLAARGIPVADIDAYLTAG